MAGPREDYAAFLANRTWCSLFESLVAIGCDPASGASWSRFDGAGTDHLIAGAVVGALWQAISRFSSILPYSSTKAVPPVAVRVSWLGPRRESDGDSR